MGFGVTMLLSMVVYLQLMRDEIPVWSTHASASLIVWLFVVSIIVIGIALIQTTLSMSMYLISGQIFKLLIMIIAMNSQAPEYSRA